MLQFPQRLCLDLPNPLSRHRELVPDFLERVIGAHADTDAHAQAAQGAVCCRQKNGPGLRPARSLSVSLTYIVVRFSAQGLLSLVPTS